MLSVTDGHRYLKAALKDSDYDVRASAARALGRIRNRHALPLLANAFQDPVSRERIAIARALGMIGGPKSVEILRIGSGRTPIVLLGSRFRNRLQEQ